MLKGLARKCNHYSLRQWTRTFVRNFQSQHILLNHIEKLSVVSKECVEQHRLLFGQVLEAQRSVTGGGIVGGKALRAVAAPSAASHSQAAWHGLELLL